MDETAADFDITCPYCHDSITDAELALCCACESPHHAECFLEHHGCTQLGCTSRRAWRPRADETTGAPEEAPPAPAVPTRPDSSGPLFLSLFTGVVLAAFTTGGLMNSHCGCHGATPELAQRQSRLSAQLDEAYAESLTEARDADAEARL